MDKKKAIIFLGIIILFIIARYLGVGDYLTFENLQESKGILLQFVSENYILAVVLFILIYIIAVGISLPGAVILTLTGGFLFGTILGTLYVNIGATFGAIIIFIIARYLFGDILNKKYEKKLKKFNTNLKKNGGNYLLTLRLIPIFPFFLINLGAGLTKISLRTFAWTTSLGIIPASFVYTFAGSQLSNINNIADIFTGKILIAFVLLGLLALVPIAYNKFKKKNKKEI